ncbi:MAG: bifunctional 4-hydroxy-3-methylbut-2-enyl diphosphate reductase/30S ribosomal protein S1 [Eubacteriales bacterium]|nr:bifunctional 4-hydroxy-3-methylbut-2-enyl diphosphate reductase/30S ribosomal protein S1 [Eubacteriales bacterium]
MIVKLAKNIGFCFGIRRAVKLAEDAALQHAPVYTLGELTHNADVIERLKQKGVLPVEAVDNVPAGGTVIIRSHGAPKAVYEACRDRGLTVIDATCPYVKKIHRIAEQAAAEGKTVCIAGKAAHPEVIGIRGWAGNDVHVLLSPDACNELSLHDAVLVSQTTLPRNQFEAIANALRPRCQTLTVFDTICDTTTQRQKEAEELSAECTKMLVIGGRNSANTQKLAELCSRHCKNTDFIENTGQIVLENYQSNDIIGIVAGASAPDWMIREVFTVMSELEKTTAESTEVEANQAKMDAPEAEAIIAEPAEGEKAAAGEPTDAVLDTDSFAEAFEKTMKRIHNGQIITGSVVQIVDGEVSVNIGYKSDGFIPKNEFSSDPDVNPADVVKVGDSIEVEVLKVNDGEGNVLLSRKSVEGRKLWDELMADDNLEGKVFEAEGKEVIKGGIIASINGVRAFVPASHVSTKYVENLNEFIGKPMRLSIIEVDRQRKRIVASQKNVLLAEMEAEKAEKWKTLEVGSKMQGVVRRLTDFGAFVDIGGIDGLVHVTDVAWGRVKHPSDVLKIGQEIEVLVLNVDTEKQRVSLGYKQLQPKPWTMAAEKYPIGSTVEGKVVRIVPFGAFVALEPTIDGLIHISQVSVQRIAKVEDEINVGDTVRCKVLDVNPEAKRISLSRKDVILEENPELAEKIAAEKAERDRQFAERAEQRAAEAQQRQQRSEQPASSEPRAPRAERAPQSDRTEQRERRPRRNSEDGDYQLPPVQSATTSLADLFQGLQLEEEAPAAVEEAPKKKAPAKKKVAEAAVEAAEAAEAPVEEAPKKKAPAKKKAKAEEPAAE